jgi:hypothetical protein
MVDEITRERRAVAQSPSPPVVANKNPEFNKVPKGHGWGVKTGAGWWVCGVRESPARCCKAAMKNADSTAQTMSAQ